MTGDPNNYRITPITIGDLIVDGLSSRVLWGLTTLNVQISYAFPDTPWDYDIAAYNALSPMDEPSNFQNLSVTQQNNALGIFNQVQGFTTANFVQGQDSSANIRIGNTGVGWDSLEAWAYHAFGNEITGGDVWLSYEQSGYSTPQAGNKHHLVMMHEIAHSLGLDHPWAGTHATQNLRTNMGEQYDSHEFTVMSYSGYARANGNRGEWADIGNSSFAQTYMPGDIYSLQWMYGADWNHNSGNTVYSWSPNNGDTRINGQLSIDATGNKIFACLWDGGGIDTYDLSAYSSGVKINLNPGESSKFSDTQLAKLGVNNNGDVFAKGNIYNPLLFQGNTASLIENAIGGSGNDIFIGNAAVNTFTGGAGADTFYIHQGVDIITDLTSADTVFYL